MMLRSLYNDARTLWSREVRGAAARPRRVGGPDGLAAGANLSSGGGLLPFGSQNARSPPRAYA
jgi:hypothetical protein